MENNLLDYCYFNPNPRKKIVADCVKRAIVVATGIDYRELELDMNRKKKKKELPYNAKTNYENYIKNHLGGVKVSCSHISKGQTRWHVNNIKQVLRLYPHLSYVFQVSKHLIGVRDLIIHDIFDDRERDKSIYAMFVFGATEQEVKALQELANKGVKQI